MNTLTEKLEGHQDIKSCSRVSDSEVKIRLHEPTGARGAHREIYDIFEWLRDEELRNGYFLYNGDAYTVQLDEKVSGYKKVELVVPVEIVEVET